MTDNSTDCVASASVPTGTYTTNVPGNVGVVNCSCTIWNNCPLYQRLQQDVTLIVSPETLRLAPEEAEHVLETIKTADVSGDTVDGVFLKPLPPQPYNNYIAALKKYPPVLTQQSLQTDIRTNYIFVPFTTPTNLGDLILNGTSVQSIAPMAYHHTWVNDGSLFSSTLLFPGVSPSIQSGGTELISENGLSLQIVATFLARWGYYISNQAGGSVPHFASAVFQSQQKDVSPLIPYQMANSIGSPSKIIFNKKVQVSFNAVDGIFNKPGQGDFLTINPGIHWRVVKKESIFQGEDFYIQFYRMAESTDIPENGDAQFYMRQEFAWLDVMQPASARLYTDEDGKINTSAQEVFDLTNQSYYAFEMGLFNGKPPSEHHYFVLIPEKGFPTFIHIGKPVELIPTGGSSADTVEANVSPDGQAAAQPSNTTVNQDKDCFPQAQQSQGNTSPAPQTTTKRAFIDKPTILSSYKIPSKELMNQQILTIGVRQHLGKIIVTFSGYENSPWIISRQDLVDYNGRLIDINTDDSNLKVDIPLIIPAGSLAIMAGNIKSGFLFSPMHYQTVPNVPIRQFLSIEGPIDISKEINLLFRDKGSSLSIDGHTLQDDSNRLGTPFGFSQDAAVFTEIINSKSVDIESILVAPQFTLMFGKAPEMQKKRSSDYIPHRLMISAKDCSTRLGSNAPFVKEILPTISMVAGNYVFLTTDGTTGGSGAIASLSDTTTGGGTGVAGDINANPDENLVKYVLPNCTTPIITNFRLFIPAAAQAFSVAPVQVAQHVMHFTDEWSATDLTAINHTGEIQFLINVGMQFDLDDDQSAFLASLADKAFYIQIEIFWSGTIDSDNVATIMPVPATDQDAVVFTGICYGGSIEIQNNRRVMSCKIYDFSKILEDQFFINSPFFDKMRDFNAVYEILQIAGLRNGLDDQNNLDNTQPSSLLYRLATYNQGGWFSLIHNGDLVINKEYALPGSYDILQQPFLRFKDGESLMQAINKIAKLSGKICYFDRLGVFHFEPLPDEQLFWNGQVGSDAAAAGQIRNQSDYYKFSKIDFFASPHDVPTAASQDPNSSGRSDGSAAATDGPLNLDPNAVHAQVFNAYTVKRNVEDTANQIKVISTTPDGIPLIAGDVNYASIFDPTTPGFVGYHKTYLQIDGIFGSEQATKWAVKHYTKMYIPPVVISFDALGHNNLKALDIISFRGLGFSNPQLLRIMSISSEADPSKNTWMQHLECEWIFPSDNIEWGATNMVKFNVKGPTG